MIFSATNFVCMCRCVRTPSFYQSIARGKTIQQPMAFMHCLMYCTFVEIT